MAAETEAEILDAIEAAQAVSASGEGRWRQVQRLRCLEEDAARAALGVALAASHAELVPLVAERVALGIEADAAQRALDHLAKAEHWQWQIGTWATGSGEGLVSMLAVRTLQLARAWLCSALAAADPARKHEALALLTEIKNDPNDVASDLMPELRTLQARLDPAAGSESRRRTRP
ncbi:MAG: hypothetical protein B6D46_03520 [Polyangiaceae bacterium UTPRO1]|nr:hypothetical protein [Myxococcales bacterium]OQY68477.1 MAG: hypothetical protein B6D46_03520 [Polyangiaceae bacterium UTPRO1]